MKKIALYMLMAIMALSSCRGHEFDTKEELEDLSKSWASKYVEQPLSNRIFASDTIKGYYDKHEFIVNTQLSDSLSSVFIFRYNNTDGDSVNVTSKFLQVRDSVVVTVDGYRYSKKFWAHLFTVDPGIINFEGKFHIDFYETDETTPWACSEIVYHRDTVNNFYYYTDKPVITWY